MFNDTDATRKIYGKYPGIVVDNQPPAGAANFQGEIKVRVSPILDENRQPIEVWAKPCFRPGFFFVPEKDDHVWVEFVAGDIDFPIWVGVWYPQGETPKTVDNQAPVTETKVIRTASGQVVQLDDSDGSEKLVITDEKNGNTITLDASGIKVEDANNTITLDANGVKIEDPNNVITMDANGVKIEDGNGNSITMSGTGGTMGKSISLNGTTQIVLKPLIDWLLKHQHVGNMGAPTPLFPADMTELMLKKDLPGAGIVSDEVTVK